MLSDTLLHRFLTESNTCYFVFFIFTDPKRKDKIDISDPNQFEIKTITSAVKNYLR